MNEEVSFKEQIAKDILYKMVNVMLSILGKMQLTLDCISNHKAHLYEPWDWYVRMKLK